MTTTTAPTLTAGANLHASVTPYREAEDPASDDYSRPTSKSTANSAQSGNAPAGTPSNGFA